ncbi:MAG: hypothetical protein ABJB05_08865 [Parafilimonas sp.]
MKQKYLACCFMVLIAAACNSNQNQSTNHDTLTQATDTTKAKPGLPYKIDTSKQINTLLPKRDTLLNVDLNNNKGSVSGYLSGIGKHVVILVPVKSGDSIIAELIPESDTANIRFTQIYIPVGKTGKYDGPFGRKLRYPTKKIKGNYKLIVGENLMAEGDWKGNFTCNVMIK